MESTSRRELASLHLELLRLELEEERKNQSELKKNGVSALEVTVRKDETEDYLYILTVECKQFLHGIEKGSSVSVFDSPPPPKIPGNHGPHGPTAVVTEVTSRILKLAFASKPTMFEDSPTLNMTLYLQEKEYSCGNRLSQAVKWLKFLDTKRNTGKDEHVIPVVREMFKENQLSLSESRQRLLRPESRGDCQRADNHQTSCVHFNPNLNESQSEAVSLALQNQPLMVLHGPPGTGKTTTIVEVIMQHVKKGKRVLVCAPSNNAVDNLLTGLWKQVETNPSVLRMKRVIRIGHPARVKEEHRQFSPDAQLEKRIRKQTRKGQKMPVEALAENMRREALVVMSTLTSVPSNDGTYSTFDLLVIDECGQATEAACWLAIPLARKVLLAGDPCQLPPTVLSQEAARRGLAKSLMERQMELHGDAADVVHMLDTQHRMHELIQAWSSEHLYDGKLKAAPEVARHMLTDLPGVRRTSHTQATLLLMDTAGCRHGETRGKTTSYQNKGEADLIVSHVKALVNAGMERDDIGVITPYKGQVALLEGCLGAARLEGVEVNSVDGYQGREKDAILLSLVRSNGKCNVGFVGNKRRLNVAVTRARRHLFIVCDTATVRHDKTIRSLVEHLRNNGKSHAAPPRSKPSGDGSGDGAAHHGGGDSSADITKLMAGLTLNRPQARTRTDVKPARGRGARRGLTRGQPRSISTTGARSAFVFPKNGQVRQNHSRPGIRRGKAAPTSSRSWTNSGSYRSGCGSDDDGSYGHFDDW